jgi:hypothetical protein
VRRSANETLRFSINGRELTGEKIAGRWYWRYAAWPDLETKYNGAGSAAEISLEFANRALAAAFTIGRAVLTISSIEVGKGGGS